MAGCGVVTTNRPCPGSWVAELTGLLKLTGWPQGMRVIPIITALARLHALPAPT
ncbi:hypothetical protein ACWDRB_55210 [Nonomuraea sp. NPDC003707]